MGSRGPLCLGGFRAKMLDWFGDLSRTMSATALRDDPCWLMQEGLI